MNYDIDIQQKDDKKDEMWEIQCIDKSYHVNSNVPQLNISMFFP